MGERSCYRKVTEKEGLHNFIVEVMLSGQLTKWKRHMDQLREYTDNSDSHDTFSDSTPVVGPQEEEEEEKEGNSDVLVYGSFSSTPQQYSNSVVEPPPPQKSSSKLEVTRQANLLRW